MLRILLELLDKWFRRQNSADYAYVQSIQMQLIYLSPTPCLASRSDTPMPPDANIEFWAEIKNHEVNK